MLGCGGGAADHETLGDRAYTERQFGDAVVEYRLALLQHAPDPDVRAKAGGAALHAGELVVAAEEYAALAVEAPERQSEAADGLERVARAALDRGDGVAVAAAIANLRRVAPVRALGGFAAQLARGLGAIPNAEEAVAILPYAAAAAPDVRIQDSLLYAYATALTRRRRCADASTVFEGLIRRQRDSALVAAAGTSLSRCALSLGRGALDAGQPLVAEEWFRKAVFDGSRGDYSRAAYIGLGDVMFARGNYTDAADAYYEAAVGAPPGDSLASTAWERLNALADAGTVVP